MFLFVNLFPIKETAHLQLFIGEQIRSQIASYQGRRQRGERKKQNGLLVAAFHLSKDHLGGHPRRTLLCFNKVTAGMESPVKAPKEPSQEGNLHH